MLCSTKSTLETNFQNFISKQKDDLKNVYKDVKETLASIDESMKSREQTAMADRQAKYTMLSDKIDNIKSNDYSERFNKIETLLDNIVIKIDQIEKPDLEPLKGGLREAYSKTLQIHSTVGAGQ